jgi:hypothetical protein
MEISVAVPMTADITGAVGIAALFIALLQGFQNLRGNPVKIAPEVFQLKNPAKFHGIPGFLMGHQQDLIAHPGNAPQDPSLAQHGQYFPHGCLAASVGFRQHTLRQDLSGPEVVTEDICQKIFHYLFSQALFHTNHPKNYGFILLNSPDSVNCSFLFCRTDVRVPRIFSEMTVFCHKFPIKNRHGAVPKTPDRLLKTFSGPKFCHFPVFFRHCAQFFLFVFIYPLQYA